MVLSLWTLQSASRSLAPVGRDPLTHHTITGDLITGATLSHLGALRLCSLHHRQWGGVLRGCVTHQAAPEAVNKGRERL